VSDLVSGHIDLGFVSNDDGWRSEGQEWILHATVWE
jgi:hypothetical protein